MHGFKGTQDTANDARQEWQPSAIVLAAPRMSPVTVGRSSLRLRTYLAGVTAVGSGSRMEGLGECFAKPSECSGIHFVEHMASSNAAL